MTTLKNAKYEITFNGQKFYALLKMICEYKNCKQLIHEDGYVNGRNYCLKHHDKIWKTGKLNNKLVVEYEVK